MSDDQTPDVAPDARDEVEAPDTAEVPPARAARGRRTKAQVTTPDTTAVASTTHGLQETAIAAAGDDRDAEMVAGDDAGAEAVRDEPTTGDPVATQVDGAALDRMVGERHASELFDASEVADAPRAPHPLKPVVEALIFASPEPLTVKAMVRVLEEHTREDIETALAQVRESYARSDGLQLVEVAGGFQIVTRPELYEWVRRLFKERTTSKLSVQALETLAVIAYKQPVTSGEIAEIRGVSATTGVLNTLLDRKLVKIVGRKQVVGRPFMYGTTREFLDKFGLRDLSDLPKVEDMSEALGFDLPSPVDENDLVSLPFDDAVTVGSVMPEDGEAAGGAPPAASTDGTTEADAGPASVAADADRAGADTPGDDS